MGIFKNVVGHKPKKSKFNLSHERKMSIKMGKLYPIMLQEVVPGDSFKVKSQIFIRLAPMISPVMHRVNVDTHYFFVPNRLLWDEWEDFITGGEDGLANPTFPYMLMNDVNKDKLGKGTLADYFGIPPAKATMVGATNLNALPFRAYSLIYNEYFRDQNLQDKLVIDTTGGQDNSGAHLKEIRTRAWEKDYFTSCLPWPQRGGAVELPTTVNYKDVAEYKPTGGATAGDGDVTTNVSGTLTGGSSLGPIGIGIENIESLGTSVNDLRRAVRLQEWLEKSARAGSRYIEQILSHFGVRSSDARLQRPEFLGSGRQPVVISEVLQTSESDVSTTDPTPLGEMAGHGISVGRSNGFTKSFEEHGYIIGLMSVLPKTAYQDGLERFWHKFDKFDYYWPEFAHLGEQEVLNKEVFMSYDDLDLADWTFGYQQRYAEYKYQKSSVHGDFRDTLNFWHMGRNFQTTPTLSEAFVKSDPTDRIFAVTDGETDTMYCQIYNKVSALRPMPYHAIPTL